MALSTAETWLIESDWTRTTTRNLTKAASASARVGGSLERVSPSRVLGAGAGWLSGRRVKAYRPPRFLLNDVIRYWRTICVDYVGKERGGAGEKWALRNLKLRPRARRSLPADCCPCCSAIAFRSTAFAHSSSRGCGSHRSIVSPGRSWSSMRLTLATARSAHMTALSGCLATLTCDWHWSACRVARLRPQPSSKTEKAGRRFSSGTACAAFRDQAGAPRTAIRDLLMLVWVDCTAAAHHWCCGR